MTLARYSAVSCINRFAAEGHIITRPFLGAVVPPADYTVAVVPSNRRFLIYHFYMQVDGASAISLYSGPSASGNVLTGPLISLGAYYWEFKNAGFPVWASSKPGSIILRVTTVAQFSGWLTYAEQDPGANI